MGFLIKDRGIPEGDTWRLPTGQYAPMNIPEMFVRDVSTKLFGGGSVNVGNDAITGYNKRLQDRLRELDDEKKRQ